MIMQVLIVVGVTTRALGTLFIAHEFGYNDGKLSELN
jgi:hypothetical protein